MTTAQSTERAALAARDRVGALAAHRGDLETTMGSLARTAIFEEALLNAIHARLGELKTVAK